MDTGSVMCHMPSGPGTGGGWKRSVKGFWGDQLLPALAWGLATAAVPLFVMQPAMGAGIASSRTPTPLLNALRSVANHAVFGLGLYFGAIALARIAA